MDVASFVATVTDVQLRREIFMNMDEATINTLPPHLMAEARGVHDFVRQDRERRVREQERLLALQQQADQRMHGMDAIFGGGRRHDQRAREEAAAVGQRREKQLEEIINFRQKQISDECPTDDIVSSLAFSIVNDEKILEALLVILLTNEKAECDLISCLHVLTKIQNQNGVPVIRNKIVNAITFLLKSIAINDDESVRQLINQQTIQKKKSTLILIGTLRLLLKQNKSLMKFILKGLISRDESQNNKGFSTQILKKQFKALSLKSSQSPDSL